MLNKRVLRIFVCGVAMLGAIATAKATSCYFPRLVTEMQIQSVTIDGVEQTDLTEYQRYRSFISPSQYNAHPKGFDIGPYGETYDPQ